MDRGLGNSWDAVHRGPLDAPSLALDVWTTDDRLIGDVVDLVGHLLSLAYGQRKTWRSSPDRLVARATWQAERSGGATRCGTTDARACLLEHSALSRQGSRPGIRLGEARSYGPTLRVGPSGVRVLVMGSVYARVATVIVVRSY